MLLYIGRKKTLVLTKAIKTLRGDPYSFTLLFTLLERARATGLCWPSLACMVKDTGFDRKTVIRSLKKLVQMGVIERLPGKEHGYHSILTRIHL